jgi:hypothetical protein
MSKPNQYLNYLIDKYLHSLILPNSKVIFIDPHFLNYPTLEVRNILQCIESCNIDSSTALFQKVDYIILDGSLQYSRDIQALLEKINLLANPTTRIIVISYNLFWIPLFKLGTFLKLRQKTTEMNWLSRVDLNNLYQLSNLEKVTTLKKVLSPFRFFYLGNLINRFVLPLPLIENLSILEIDVIKTLPTKLSLEDQSVSVIVPVRNEAGTIALIVEQIPKLSSQDEIIFVEGGSKDNTWEKVLEIQDQYALSKNIISLKQTGIGKGDAVRAGFARAKNNIFMIYDADMTVPAGDLIKFHKALVDGKGELINGSRLVYPMDNNAMKFLNMLANKFFAKSFSFVLGQPLKDTLCGTKVLSRVNYEKIMASRSFFGSDDPFGDFDLLFGSSKNCLKIIEIPITYRERTYGETNISRWSHGWMLLKMLVKASLKIKFT